MLTKIFKTALNLVGKGESNFPHQNMGHQGSTHMHNTYYQQSNNFIPPELNPNLNPSADWNYYRQLVDAQNFVNQQSQGVTESYQQQQMYSQVLDNMRSQRFAQQSQQLANGANPEYYARLNAAYQRGVDKMQSKQGKKK